MGKEKISKHEAKEEYAADTVKIDQPAKTEKMTIQWNGAEQNIEVGKRMSELLPPEQYKGNNPVMLIKVNHKIGDLNYIPQEGDTIEDLTLATMDGWRAYQRGLIFLFILAAKECLPGSEASILHSLGSGVYIEVNGVTLSPFDLDRIGRKMREYVDENKPFQLSEISKAEALVHYQHTHQPDKAALLAFREGKETFKIYRFENMRDYFFGYMPPSSGYLQRFQLEFEWPGLVLLQPAMDNPNEPIAYHSSHKLMHVFRESERWARLLECTTVADLNQLIKDGGIEEFILVNEARHDKEIAEYAHYICEQKTRLVTVAGPSSSGKTTFTQKLRLQLRANGKKPVMISLDNYYADRNTIPLQEDGSIDLEHINTLQLDLFNEHLERLLAGEKVQIPRFDFPTGRCIRESGRWLEIGEDGILLIEGIHGLNDELTASVIRKDKFKIYISALTQLNLDRHNRIPTTDVRLIRRMVRDSQHRNADAETTLAMWSSVRAGEDRWIFPYQERCDVMFNSTLVYELAFLKRYAYPLLQAVAQDSPYFSEANRLLKFLNYFSDPGPEDGIPNTSLLREFIGGGVFEQ